MTMIKEAVRGITSNTFMQLEAASEGHLLVLENLHEQQFHGIGTTASLGRTASTDRTIALATADLRDFIAFEFSLIPDVEYVFTAFRENQIFYAWIVTDKFEESVRDQIYDHEQAIIDEFPTFEFDFYIIARMGRTLDDLIGDDSMHLTYARK
jgi:hypothetical protein